MKLSMTPSLVGWLGGTTFLPEVRRHLHLAWVAGVSPRYVL
jgi:hypothetical protein